MPHTLIIANGYLADGAAVQAAIAASDYIIAADGGADHARHLGVVVDLVVGDMDSITDDTLAHNRTAGVEVMEFPAEKDQTDLEIALLEAAARRPSSAIRIVGGLGNRLDQTLANIYLLTMQKLDAFDVRLVSGEQTIWYVQAGHHALMGAEGDTLSLVPLGGDVGGITTQGLQYPLHDDRLKFGHARGISNVIESAEPSLSFTHGQLLVIHTIGRA